MQITTTENIKPFTSDSGEIIREIFGNSANNFKDFSLAHISLEPKGQGLSHYHPSHYEAYYMLEGIATLTINKQQKQLSAGDAVLINLNDVHSIENNTESTVKFLAFCSPSWTPECSVFVESTA